MEVFLSLAFLFFIGCTLGWGLEVFYRRFKKANIARKWINPGMLAGPYLPIYGLGLCMLYLLASLENTAVIENVTVLSKIILFVVMAIFMTVLEFVAGIIFIKILKVKLWDYSDEKFNIMGIICPRFSFFWALLGAVYYFFIHPWISAALNWFGENIAFSFFIGMFFGVFTIDLIYSFNLIAKVRAFAAEHEIVVTYENLRAEVLMSAEKKRSELRAATSEIIQAGSEKLEALSLKPKKLDWFLRLRSDVPLKEHLERYIELMDVFNSKY